MTKPVEQIAHDLALALEDLAHQGGDPMRVVVLIYAAIAEHEAIKEESE